MANVKYGNHDSAENVQLIRPAQVPSLRFPDVVIRIFWLQFIRSLSEHKS